MQALVSSKFPGMRIGRVYKRKPRANMKLAKRKKRGGEKLSNPMYGRVKNIAGLSEEVYLPMVYSQLYSFQCGTLGVFGTEQVWNLNSTFDIDLTGTGHQPYLRDQYAALYAKYKVLAVKINITCSDPSADGLVVAFQLSPPAGTVALAGQTPTTVGERPDTDLKYINNTGAQRVVFNRYRSIQSLSGLTKLQFGADLSQYCANVNSDPAAIPKLRVAAADLNAPVGQAVVKLVFRFTQYVKWYDRVVQAQS